MKASRILAGMSAAAFVASMLTMVSFADEPSTEKTYDVAGFGVQGYVQDSTTWAWQAKQVDGAVNLTYNYTELVEKYGEAEYTGYGISGAGVQFYASDEGLEQDEILTADIEYKITAKDFEESKTLNFKKQWDKTARNWSVPEGEEGAYGAFVDNGTLNLFGTKTWDELIGLGDVTVEATVSNIKVEKAEPVEEDFSLPYSPAEIKEYSDWGDQGYISSKVYQNVPEGKGATVSIEYNVKNKADDNGGIYRLAKLALADGWGAAYDASIQDKYDEAVADEGEDSDYAKGLKEQLWKGTSITDGFPAEKSLDEDEVTKRKADNAGDPSINNDGFFVFYYADDYTDKGTLTFHLSPECVKAFAAENETGYGGSLFQVWNIDITKVTVDVAEDEPVKTDGFNAFEMYTDNWTYQQMSQEDADARGVGFTVTADTKTYVAESVPAYYDAEGALVYGEVPEGTDAYKVTGATVWCVDIDGLADAVGAGTAGLKNEDGSDLTNADKMKLAQDAGIEISNVQLLVDGKPFYNIDDSKLLYGDIEGNGKIRLEVYNEYGETGSGSGDFWDADRVDAITKEANAGTHYGVQFDITGIPDEVPPAEPVYEFAPAEGVETEYTVKSGEELELGVLLTQDGEAVKDEDVNWVFTTEEYKTTVEKTGESEGEVVVIPTDESGISTAYYTAGSESKIVTVVATLENAEDYGDVEPVVFTIYQNVPESQDPSSAPEPSSSSSSSNSSNGGNSSSAPASDNNPATGAAALGTVGILLAGAAMAVSKKKH